MTYDPTLRFLSEEDLDLRSLPAEEFDRPSALAFLAVQATNDRDGALFRHGCVAVEPGHEHLLPLIRSGAI